MYGQAYIEWTFEQEAEFIWLAQLVDLVRANERTCKINLNMPYFPYARQDKEVSNETTFAKTTFVKLLNSLKLDNIESVDVHSSGADKVWIHNFTNRLAYDSIRDVVRQIGPTVIAFPDKGAAERYTTIGHGFQVVYGEKVRDQATGEITGLSLKGEIFDTDRVLIVDDICDGGRTFIELAKLMQNAQSISLYTTHALYSKGTKVLRDAGISRLFDRMGERI